MCHSPELLRTLQFRAHGPNALNPNPPHPLPRLLALLRLLAVHGRHVQSLDIFVYDSRTPEAAPLVTACLEACSAVGGTLQELRVGRWTPLDHASWLARLTRLTSLELGSADHPFRLPAEVSKLTDLQTANLSGRPLVLAGLLPTSLMRLDMSDMPSTAMPTQVRLHAWCATVELLSCHC